MNPSMFELTLEQQFQVERVRHEAEGLPRDEVLTLLLDVSKLLMLKDNVIRDLMKQSLL
jgi:hypothetical protein